MIYSWRTMDGKIWNLKFRKGIKGDQRGAYVTTHTLTSNHHHLYHPSTPVPPLVNKVLINLRFTDYLITLSLLCNLSQTFSYTESSALSLCQHYCRTPTQIIVLTLQLIS